MSHLPPAPLAAIARDALLACFDGADARLALRQALEHLGAAWQGPCAVQARDAGGGTRWIEGKAPASGWVEVPLLRGGREVGVLRLAAEAATDAAALAAELQAVTPALAALVEATEQASPPANAALETIAAHVPGVLYLFELHPDRSSRFLFVSQQARELIGVEPNELLRDPRSALAVIDRAERRAMLENVLTSARDLTVWRQEFPLRRPDGQQRWILGTASPQREPDGRILWYGYLQDVTERRELERVRGEAAAAAAANHAKTEFLSHMSHELRTPLNAVIGFAQLLEMDEADPPSEGQRRRLRLVREAGDHLLKMIGDLLDLTRIESGTLVLGLEPVALRPLAEAAMSMVQTAAERAQVRLALKVAGPAAAMADPTRLRQVLLNLLSNAIKYNRSGGLVEVRIEPGGVGEVVLAVRDTGQGISEADQLLLFQPFQRGRQAHGRIEGAGIGLSVSKSLVRMMHGAIEVYSVPGSGSEFRVRLPLA